MDREQTAIFIGHRDCVALKPQRLEDAIIKHMEQGVRLFLNGGMGRYDEMCASVVHRLKQRYPGSRSELVIPYLSFKLGCGWYNLGIFQYTFVSFYVRILSLSSVIFLVLNY